MAMNALVRPGAGVPGVPDPRAAAALFHGLADPSRLAILLHLTTGEQRVVDLTAHLGLAQSTVSKHLACLRASGLVDSRVQGRASWFALHDQESLLDLLASAGRLLAGDGTDGTGVSDGTGGMITPRLPRPARGQAGPDREGP